MRRMKVCALYRLSSAREPFPPFPWWKSLFVNVKERLSLFFSFLSSGRVFFFRWKDLGSPSVRTTRRDSTYFSMELLDSSPKANHLHHVGKPA